MSQERSIWLVANPSSGSNDDAALEALENACGNHGFRVSRKIEFPDHDLPTAAELDAAGQDLVAVFAGDGTVNTLVTQLYGWGGAILVLPGGTMNLLAKRLHGDTGAARIVEQVGAGKARRSRPTVVRSRHGDSLTGLMVGPATAWNEVREAMRAFDIIGIADYAADAIAESTGGVMTRCIEPRLGRAQGYPMLILTPVSEGIETIAYHSESFGEYARQGFALLKRNFRDGPHDSLGTADAVTLESVDDAPLEMLIDGEPAEGTRRERFEIARCEVDLLATTRD